MKRSAHGRDTSILFACLSPGAWAIIGLAVVSSALVIARPSSEQRVLNMWTFARPHAEMYAAQVELWNALHPEKDVQVSVLSIPALERRMLSAFLAGTPVADLLEVERSVAARAMSGPPETVGFLDLTERLAQEGMLEKINPPSFSPWTTDGRIYGIPHDVHPVLLAYRSDLVDEAGIDVSEIETWADFVRVMSPLMADADADGKPDRYLLAMWETLRDQIEVLMLQAGGGFFDVYGKPNLDSEINARVAAQIVSWCTGPDRIATEVPDFSASGHKLRLDGYVVCSFVPDWMCNVWKHEIPQMGGKVKLMPLPAWEPGGRRTSVWGGTMLGLEKTSPDLEKAWSFAKHLYLSDEQARILYTEGDIITPITSHWEDPVFDEPDPYFCNQAKGRMYIDAAPDVPRRNPSPYYFFTRDRVRDAVSELANFARANGVHDPESLLPESQRILHEAQEQILRRMARNVFVEENQG